jgi:hypothetical protein
MSGLDDPGVVDLVGEEPTGEISLIIAHNLGWTDDPDELASLAEKINNYTTFALDGGLTSKFPDYANRPVRILIDCTAAPTTRVEALLNRARAQLSPYSIEVAVNISA